MGLDSFLFLCSQVTLNLKVSWKAGTRDRRFGINILLDPLPLLYHFPRFRHPHTWLTWLNWGRRLTNLYLLSSTSSLSSNPSIELATWHFHLNVSKTSQNYSPNQLMRLPSQNHLSQCSVSVNGRALICPHPWKCPLSHRSHNWFFPRSCRFQLLKNLTNLYTSIHRHQNNHVQIAFISHLANYKSSQQISMLSFSTVSFICHLTIMAYLKHLSLLQASTSNNFPVLLG